MTSYLLPNIQISPSITSNSMTTAAIILPIIIAVSDVTGFCVLSSRTAAVEASAGGVEVSAGVTVSAGDEPVTGGPADIAVEGGAVEEVDCSVGRVLVTAAAVVEVLRVVTVEEGCVPVIP